MLTLSASVGQELALLASMEGNSPHNEQGVCGEGIEGDTMVSKMCLMSIPGEQKGKAVTRAPC